MNSKKGNFLGKMKKTNFKGKNDQKQNGRCAFRGKGRRGGKRKGSRGEGGEGKGTGDFVKKHGSGYPKAQSKRGRRKRGVGRKTRERKRQLKTNREQKKGRRKIR